MNESLKNTLINDAGFLKRLYWHSRRGMLELDLLLIPFVEQQYTLLSAERQKAYIDLLACEDQDIFAWLMQRKIPDEPALADIVALIIEDAR